MGGTYMSKTYCYISCLLPTFGDLCFFVADEATLIEWPFDVANIKACLAARFKLHVYSPIIHPILKGAEKSAE